MNDIGIPKPFTALAAEYAMFPHRGHVLCAVSGGADSVCLLHLLKGRAEAEDFLQRAGASTTEGEAPENPQREGIAVAYVDGSFSKDTGEFACGAVLFWKGERVLFSKKYNDPALAEMHNVAGEILGAVAVIRYCLDKGIPALEIHHDYEGVGKWATGLWKANKPGTQAYAALCKQAMERLQLSFVKVKGHSGNQWNDLADQLARRALGKEKSEK